MIELWILILKGLEQLKDAVLKGIDLNKEKREIFLSNYVEPTFLKIKGINADYTSSFSELLENIQQKKDPKKTVALFRKRRLTMLPERKELQSLVREIIELEQKKFFKNKQLQSYCRFAQAIDEYFFASSKATNISWYSEFVEKFEKELDNGKNPFELKRYKSIGGGHDCLPPVEKQIQYALHEEMPKAWKKVCTAYNNLKLSML